MATTNVPLPEFTPAGLLTFDEQAILAGVQQDYVQAFALNGKELNIELTTPQGQLMQSQAFMVAAFQAALAELIAQVDPLTSNGAYQDAIGRIYFLTRQAATFATVQATAFGVVGNTLPVGSQAVSGDGSIWATTSTVVFGSGGSVSVQLQALVAGRGPVAGIDDLRIYQAVSGWESITNATASTPGTDVEGRAQFEARRFASTQINGSGTVAAIKAAIDDVQGVSDSFVYNNVESTTVNFGATNYPVPPHSVAISVAGGTNANVATAIWTKVDTGCGFSSQGTVSVTIQDTQNYSPPYPTYTVRFIRPTTTQVYFTVNVSDVSTLPDNYVPLVQEAVANAFTNGFVTTDGTIAISRARIGTETRATEFAAPILALGNISPISIFVGLTAAPSSGETVTMGIDQLPVCTMTNVTVNAV